MNKPNGYELMTQGAGSLPSFSNVGGYSILYLDAHNNTFCPTCAEKIVSELVHHYIYWEGSSMFCEECNEELPSEYGEVEDND